MPTFKDTIVNLIQDFRQKRIHLLAAALSFYALFSFTPMIVIVLAVGGVLFDDQALLSEIESFFASQVSPNVSDFWMSQVTELQQTRGEGALIVIGTLILIVAATRLFVQLRDALIVIGQDAIPEHKTSPTVSLFGIKERIWGIALLLIASVSISLMILFKVAAQAFVRGIGFIPFTNFWVSLFGYFPLGLIFFFTWLAYRMFLPLKLTFKVVTQGALICTSLLALMWKALQLYLSFVGSSSLYGAASSFFVFLLWLYLSSQIFLFSALITTRLQDKKQSQPELKKGST